jgi:pimeloyl-ACP methyl ester carboxylesterase
MLRPAPASATRPVYVARGDEPVFALFDAPAEPRLDVAVVLCAPFGWEDMCSYRSRRLWAQRLARAGIAALRVDLPGTGDSGGGPRDPDRLGAWVGAIGAAAAWLRETTGCRRVAAIGIGFGGLVAHHAASAGAGLDELVLWGVPARGRTLVRELTAFSRMETAQLDGVAAAAGEDAVSEDGSLVTGGYLLTAATLDALRALDLSAGAPVRRALLLERDGRAVDARLREGLEAAGAEVAVAPGDGYARMMMEEPQDARPALALFERVEAWLAAAAAPAAAPPPAAPAAPEPVRVRAGDAWLREVPFTVEHPFGRPFGVLTEPEGPVAELCLVLLNAGPQRRTGPNRMWVEIARRWAARGVPVLRLDLAGIGDADGDDSRFVDVRAFYEPEYLDQVRSVLDALDARGLPRRVVLGGLCVGGYWALQMAIEHERVGAALMLNPGAFVFDGGVSGTLREGRAMARKLLQPSAWLRVLRKESSFAWHGLLLRKLVTELLRAPVRVPARLLARRRAQARGGDDVDLALDRLRDRGRRALAIFAGTEPLYDALGRGGQLERLERWPNVRLEHVEVPADVHTLRPLWLQRRVHRIFDEGLARELEDAQGRRAT